MSSVNQRWALAFVVMLLAAVLAVVQLHAWGLPWAVAGALGVAQTVPVATVRRWPVWSWAVAAAALTGSTFLGVGQGDLRWPWPAASYWAVLVAVAVVSATRRRRDAIAVGAVTAAVVFGPALVTVPLPLGVVVLAVAWVAVAVVLRDSIRTRRQAQAALWAAAAQRAILAERARSPRSCTTSWRTGCRRSRCRPRLRRISWKGCHRRRTPRSTRCGGWPARV